MASMALNDLGPMLTASEVAEMLHLHVNTVKRLGDRGPALRAAHAELATRPVSSGRALYEFLPPLVAAPLRMLGSSA